jgi:hypothetical protein
MADVLLLHIQFVNIFVFPMAIMSSFINANDTGEALNVVEFGIDSIVFSLYVARNHEQSAN